MFVTVATIILGVGCGFGAAVWFIVAAWHRKQAHQGIAFWYIVLALAYLACTIVIAGRTLGYLQELPRGASLLLLGPILGIPPAIQLKAWLNARRLLKAQRG